VEPRRRVVIAQEYVATYRVPFFHELKRLLAPHNVDVVVAAGAPSRRFRDRNDADTSAIDVTLAQREFSVFGRRVVFRRLGGLRRDADLLIVEQARRNVDVYWTALRRDMALWGLGSNAAADAGWLRRALLRWLTRRARWFFAYTPSAAAAATAMGLDPRRITVVYNSTDVTPLLRECAAITPDLITQLRHEVGVGGTTALFVGALEPNKRIEFLLDVAREAARIDPSFRLVMVGEGSLEATVRAYPGHNVVLLPRATGPDLARLAATARVLTMPGNVGLVAVDALVLGLPTVTTDWPGHGPERAYLDETTSVTAPNDARGFAEALIALLHDEPRLETMSAACKAAASEFGIDRMAEHFAEGVLAALADGQHGQSRPR